MTLQEWLIRMCQLKEELEELGCKPHITFDIQVQSDSGTVITKQEANHEQDG